MTQIVFIVLGLTITFVTLGVYGNKFVALFDEEIQKISLFKDKFGMTEVYRDIQDHGLKAMVKNRSED